MTHVRTPPVARVDATPEAIAMLRTLAEQHGPLMIHQSGGCCDGSSPMCYPRDDFLVGDGDVLLGAVGDGVPVYIGAQQYAYWSHTHLTIDLVRGRGAGFSLEAPEGYRFLVRSRLFTDEEALALEAAGPPPRGSVPQEEGPAMTQPDAQPDADAPMTDEQSAELRRLAERVGEDVPTGMRAAEAAQRIEELRAQVDG